MNPEAPCVHVMMMTMARDKAMANDAYVAVYRRAIADGWPYDFGDDPSFQASKETGGRITWGVCRPNVRNKLKAGDLVVFIAVDRELPARYQFVGFATVDRRVSRDAIWRDSRLKVYRNYRNLLVRSAINGFEHHEPRHFDRRVWHRDWLDRIIDADQRNSKGIDEIQRGNFLTDASKAAGQLIRLGENYVIFRPHGVETLILTNPPTIAVADGRSDHERWLDDRFARGLRTLIIAPAPRDYLRTASFRPHPYIRLVGVDVPTLRNRLRELVSSVRQRRIPKCIPARTYPKLRPSC